MGHDDCRHDFYDSYPTNYISQNRLESSLDDLAEYEPFSKKSNSKPRYYQNDSFYSPTYLHTTTDIQDRQSSRPLSDTNKDWSKHSHFGDVLTSPDSSSAALPYLSYIEEPWSPESVTTEADDDASLASSVSSCSPNSDLDTFLGEPNEDDDDDNFYSSPAVSPRQESLYQPLEQYSHERSAYLDDDDLSPLTFSPPSLGSLRFLSLSESEHDPTTQKPSTYSPPFQPPQFNYHSYFDYECSTPAPCSPSRRRSATLPELEPTYNTDLFGLHKSIQEAPPSCDIDMDTPEMRWYSFPGCETDDDLIPVELASKNYIPDPSVIVPTNSAGTSSLLLWDPDHNDRSDIPSHRTPSPEPFFLDPSILADCGDEELQKVYELRQRTAKNEKWERERCRELSALLRLKLDERGVLGNGEGGDYSDHQSGSRSFSCNHNFPFSSSPSSNSPTIYQPQPRIASSFSPTPSPVSSFTQNPIPVPTSSSSPIPTLLSTSGKPHAQCEGPKHKIRSMAQLVASMFFHRQCDALRRHPSRKAVEPTCSSHYSAPSSLMGGAGMKVLAVPRSRLSMVVLPEELEIDSERKEGQGVDMEVETGDEAEEEKENMIADLDDGSLSRSCLDMDLDEGGGSYGNTSSHTVTWAAPPCTRESTQ